MQTITLIINTKTVKIVMTILYLLEPVFCLFVLCGNIPNVNNIMYKIIMYTTWELNI